MKAGELKFDKCFSTVGVEEPDKCLCMKNIGRRVDKAEKVEYRREGSV